MSKQLDGLFLYEIILLFLGVFLFVVLVIVLIYFVIKHRPIKSLILFFPLPIVMIGFPGIQNFRLGKDLLYVEKAKEQITENPSDSVTKAMLINKLKTLESRPISDPKILSEIAEAEAVVGDSVKALKITEEIIENNPESDKARHLMEQLSTPTVRLEQGIHELQQNPKDEIAQTVVMENLQNLENRSSKSDPYITYKVAKGYLALGDTTKAIMRLDSTIKYAPANKSYVKFRKKLDRRSIN